MEENRLWTNLPVDAFEEIMKRLPLKDYLGLRIICRSWKELVSKTIANKNCCPLPELPRVFLQTKDPCFFFSLITKSIHHAKTLLLDHNQICCHGSVEGWLIVSDYSEEGCAAFFFWNPVTDVRIIIPSKLYFPSNFPVLGDRLLYVTKMVASSKPNSDGSESDCYLVGLMTSFCHIAVYKLFDKSWTIIEPDKDSRICFMDVEIIGTKLFVTDSTSNSILVYELKNSTNGPSKAEMMVKLPQVRPPESSMIGDHRIFIGLPKCYLAKDGVLGELYLIYMYGNMEYNTQHVEPDRSITFSTFVTPLQVTTVEVFKLDMNKYPIGWLNVKLDDKVAFVSNWKSIVMSRDERNYNKELTTGNSLYFLINVPCPKHPRSSLRLGMFCLNGSSTKCFPMKISKHCDVRYPFWFVPSIW